MSKNVGISINQATKLLVVVFTLSSAWEAAADERSHIYNIGEPVVLWVNKVGPYNNPQQTYNYFYLPFCRPKPHYGKDRNWGNLGEVLEGNQLVNSGLDIRFRVNVEKSVVCVKSPSPTEEAKLRKSIRSHYWYELFVDELPMWGFVGDMVKSGPHTVGKELVFTHKALKIGYNRNQIIETNLKQPKDSLVEVKNGRDLVFTYSVEWVEMDVPFENRFEKYLDEGFFEHKIHWFSIFNSFLLVVFLVGVVLMILLRTLRKDYARYTAEDELDSLEMDLSEESGWKLVHGDVFRAPRFLPLLASLVGTGVQLAVLCLCVMVITIAGTLFQNRGSVLTYFIICYTLTSVVGGYVSGGLYARQGGRRWINTMCLTATLFPGIVFSISFVLNTIAVAYHSLAAVPFPSIVLVILMWACISLPLCLLGTIVGRHWSSVPNNPCRVKHIPSPIPKKKWFQTPGVISLAAGLLPFGSIFIELYFILSSFWNYKVYYVYGFMLLVYMILMVVTVCVTIVATYVLLNAENYQWQWTSFASACSTAMYVFLYSFFYFFRRTTMTGFFQTCFYFGYTAIVCCGLGIMCGGVGYLGAAVFVRRIYTNIKCD